MYTRITTFKVAASKLSELPAKIQEMKPAAKALPGIIDIYASWRSDGHGVVTSVYKDHASAESAAPQIKALWAGLGGLLAAPPTSEAYDHVEHMVG